MRKGYRRTATTAKKNKLASAKSAIKKATSPYTTTSYLGKAAPKKRTRKRRVKRRVI